MSSFARLLNRFLPVPLYRTGLKNFSVSVQENEGLDLNNKLKTTTSDLQKIFSPESCYTQPREVWVENFNTIQEEKCSIIRLHPEIFATIPRLDIIYENVKWQKLYKRVDRTHAKTKAECRGGGKKPWPQKGTGRARQGSIRSPQFVKGGTCHGPRNPKTYFYMISFHERVKGLTSTLSAKFAQDDIHVVENLNIPSEDPDFILSLMEERAWGNSILIVDKEDIMPRNIVAATENIGHVNLMPVYGLNVYSMLKHETLVLTVDAVNEIHDRLLTILHSARDKELNVPQFRGVRSPFI